MSLLHLPMISGFRWRDSNKRIIRGRQCDNLMYLRELLKSLGVDSLIVDDLYSLDDEFVATMQPVHAFVFLFKWVGSSGDENGGGSGSYDHDFPGFFAKQVRAPCLLIANSSVLVLIAPVMARL